MTGETPHTAETDASGNKPNSRKDTLMPGHQAFVPHLAASLAGLLRLRGTPLSLRRLTAHLPGGFTPPTVEDCLNAAEIAGAPSRMMALPSLADIPLPALPCILLLGEDSMGQRQTCILLGIEAKGAGRHESADSRDSGPDDTASTDGTVRIIFPETEPEAVSMPLSDLEAWYSGFAVFLPSAAPRSDPRVDSLPLTPPRHWFWGVLREFVPIYRDVALASFVVNLLSLASPLFVMNVYDRVVPNNAVYTLWVLAAGLLIAHAMDFALRNLRSYFVDTAGRNADVIITSRLMDAILRMRLDNKPESTGGMVNNLREFEQVRDFFGSTTLLAVFDLPFLAVFLLLVAFIGGPMVLLLLFALPLMLLFVWAIQAPFQQSVARQLRQNMQKNALLVEITAGLETVKSTLAQGHMKHQWESVVDAAAAESARTRQLASLAQSGTLFITYLVNAGVIIFGVYRIQEGLLTQGGLIACVILVSRALGPLMQITTMITHMQKSRMALKALEQIVNLPSEQDGGAKADSTGLVADIGLRDVTFRYPGSQKLALQNVSLRIRPGEKVGVVGATGSGKSTLARLLVGLYQPTEGNITFGGVDIRQLDQADLRSRIGFMPQDNFLFYGSVRENIALGSPWLDMKTLVKAARIAGVDSFVNTHPAGYDMPVGERGLALSGGQRQAVALARTLVRAPEVLVLDEPSSNLDMEGEHALMLRLRDIVRNKTLIIMTHRPSLLSLVDRVIVIIDGRIAADGPRDAVLRAMRDGRMRRLHTGEGGKHG